MKSLWVILATLTLARTTMGFQFQSIAAVGPVFIDQSIITHTELGVLIGIYLLPGVLFAIPGGWLGQRFGDKRVVLFGLTMMMLGGALIARFNTYEIMLFGRLISGLGAVLLNVLTTKMVADWFAESRIAMAMGFLISSWPLGIAIALLIMGPLEQMALFPVLVIYTKPPGQAESAKVPTEIIDRKFTRYEFWGVVLSGCVWCFYNVAFILPLSFGPEYLVTKGLTITSAGAVVSLASWLIIPALPLGALIAERIGRPFATMIVTFMAIAVLMGIFTITPFYAVIFALLGLIFGPAGGLIMALPAQVLSIEKRAVGMGVFFAIYYAGMGILPAIAGYALDISRNPAAPFILACVAILFAALALVGFRVIQNKQRTNHAATQ